MSDRMRPAGSRSGLARWRRPLRLGLAVAAVAAIAGTFWMSISDAPRVAADAYTYLAAGERLNAGHDLYTLQPGDRWIWINPPYWTVPLLSPPLIGVVFRPLAAIPNDLGLLVWQAISLFTVSATVAALLFRIPVRAATLTILLAVPIGFEMDVANVNSVLLGGFVLTWWLFARHRSVVGALIAVMAAVKVAPLLLGWWLVTQRRWSAVAQAIVAGVIVLLVGVLGSSLDAHLRYLSIASQTLASGNSDLSLAGLGVAIGLPAAVAAFLPRAVLVLGILLIWLVRGRPGLAFAVAVAVAVFGSPVVNFNTLALLLATLAPMAWPLVPSIQKDLAGTTGWFPGGRHQHHDGRSRIPGST